MISLGRIKYLATRAFDSPKEILPFLRDRIRRVIFSWNRFYVSSFDALIDEKGKIWHSAEEKEVTITPLEDDGDLFKASSGSYKPDDRFVAELNNCDLYGPGAIGLYNGKVILETCVPSKYNFLDRLDYLIGKSTTKFLIESLSNDKLEPEKEFDIVFPLIPFYGHNFYKWMVEYLPKLRMLEYYEKQTGEKLVILIPEDAPKFMIESLSLLGFENRIKEYDCRKAKARKVVFTQHRSHRSRTAERKFSHDEPSQEDCKWLVNKFKSEIDTDSLDRSNSQRIYISRQKAEKGRKVANYEELLDLLNSHNIESYIFEELSLEDQIKICSNADFIMSPHGAGLTHCIFSKKDAKVLELFPKGKSKSTYYILSEVMDLEYDGLVTKSTGDNNLIIDTDKLSSKLEKL